MTIIAYTSTKDRFSGYFRYGLDGVALGVTQTYFIAEMICADLVSAGIAYADLINYRAIWIAEITFNTVLPNTSKLRSSVSKFTLGYYDIDYWGAISASGYLQYLSQRCPTQACRLTRDEYVYPSLVRPDVVGVADSIYPLYPLYAPVQTGTTFHFLLDQVNPIGSTVQFQYVAFEDGGTLTPPIYYTTF